MTDVTANALRGIVKTLADVVLPAIPADDPLAQQELKMVLRYLAFTRERVDHIYARARYELEFHCGLAADLAVIVESAALKDGKALRGIEGRARTVLAQPGAAIGTLRSLNGELTDAIGALLRAITDMAVLSKLERRVVEASAEISAFDRSWYAPLKLERFPAEVRPLGDFIAIAHSS